MTERVRNENQLQIEPCSSIDIWNGIRRRISGTSVFDCKDWIEMQRQEGFSLLELLTIIGVLAILAGMGIPVFNAVTRSSRAVSYTNDFVSTMHTARLAAVTKVSQVTVCKSTDQQLCNNAASWEDGWIVFVDTDEDEVRDVGVTSETLLRAHDSLHQSNSLQSAEFTNWIAFRPNGLTLGTVANAGTFSLCHATDDRHTRIISINRTGSPSLLENNGACVE